MGCWSWDFSIHRFGYLWWGQKPIHPPTPETKRSLPSERGRASHHWRWHHQKNIKTKQTNKKKTMENNSDWSIYLFKNVYWKIILNIYPMCGMHMDKFGAYQVARWIFLPLLYSHSSVIDLKGNTHILLLSHIKISLQEIYIDRKIKHQFCP